LEIAVLVEEQPFIYKDVPERFVKDVMELDTFMACSGVANSPFSERFALIQPWLKVMHLE